MRFSAAVRHCFDNYATFKGRASRAEFWYFILFTFMCNLAALMLDSVIGMGLFSLIVLLALIIPSWAVAVRRLHDSDLSGWWILLAIIPGIGWIFMVYFGLRPSTESMNRFGPAPFIDVDVVL